MPNLVWIPSIIADVTGMLYTARLTLIDDIALTGLEEAVFFTSGLEFAITMSVVSIGRLARLLTKEGEEGGLELSIGCG